jgi:hypothetical protein
MIWRLCVCLRLGVWLKSVLVFGAVLRCAVCAQKVDPEMATGLRWMLHNDITGVLENTFSVLKEVDPSDGTRPVPPCHRPDDTPLPQYDEVDLIPDGANVAVTISPP